MRTVQTLSLEDADRALAAMRAALNTEGRSAVLVVADVHGDVIATLRLDGAPPSSVTIACNKAWTAATLRQPSRQLGARLRNADENFDITYFGDRRACGWAGGLPVYGATGEVVGAVAVSGLPELEDERIAAIGVAALAPPT